MIEDDESAPPAPLPVVESTEKQSSAKSQPPVLAATDEIVEGWWNDHFPGSILARNTEVWNYVRRATDALKRRLRE